MDEILVSSNLKCSKVCWLGVNILLNGVVHIHGRVRYSFQRIFSSLKDRNYLPLVFNALIQKSCNLSILSHENLKKWWGSSLVMRSGLLFSLVSSLESLMLKLLGSIWILGEIVLYLIHEIIHEILMARVFRHWLPFAVFALRRSSSLILGVGYPVDFSRVLEWICWLSASVIQGKGLVLKGGGMWKVWMRLSPHKVYWLVEGKGALGQPLTLKDRVLVHLRNLTKLSTLSNHASTWSELHLSEDICSSRSNTMIVLCGEGIIRKFWNLMGVE